MPSVWKDKGSGLGLGTSPCYACQGTWCTVPYHDFSLRLCPGCGAAVEMFMGPYGQVDSLTISRLEEMRAIENIRTVVHALPEEGAPSLLRRLAATASIYGESRPILASYATTAWHVLRDALSARMEANP